MSETQVNKKTDMFNRTNMLIKEITSSAINCIDRAEFPRTVETKILSHTDWDLVKFVEFSIDRNSFIKRETTESAIFDIDLDFYSPESEIILETQKARDVMTRELKPGDPLEKYEKKLLQEGFRFAYLFPITVRDKFVGVFACFSRCETRADVEEISFMKTVGEVLTLSWEMFFQKKKHGDLEEKVSNISNSLIQMESVRILGDLIPGVANEINNILTGILGYSELMERGKHDAQVIHLVEEIKRSALMGKNTIKSLQEFKDLDLEAEFALVELEEIIEKAVQLTKPRWRDEAWAKNIEYKIEMDLRPVNPIMGNRAALLEAMISVIFKALDSIPKGGRVTIQTYQKPESMEIIFRTTGEAEKTPGFAIYDLFFHTRDLTDGESNIKAALEIMRRHGGNINLEAKLGHGSIITLTLPSITREIKQREEKAKSLRKSTQSILVVEDDQMVCTLIKDALRFEGFQVTMAGDGYEALDLLRENRYDLMLTDLGMPGMSGYQLAIQAKEIYPDIPIIMATGWESRIDRQKMAEYKIDYIVGKPFVFEDLFEAIKASIQKNMEEKE